MISSDEKYKVRVYKIALVAKSNDQILPASDPPTPFTSRFPIKWKEIYVPLWWFDPGIRGLFLSVAAASSFNMPKWITDQIWYRSDSREQISNRFSNRRQSAIRIGCPGKVFHFIVEHFLFRGTICAISYRCHERRPSQSNVRAENRTTSGLLVLTPKSREIPRCRHFWREKKHFEMF